jgi:hypothetical protein
MRQVQGDTSVAKSLGIPTEEALAKASFKTIVHSRAPKVVDLSLTASRSQLPFDSRQGPRLTDGARGGGEASPGKKYDKAGVKKFATEEQIKSVHEKLLMKIVGLSSPPRSPPDPNQKSSRLCDSQELDPEHYKHIMENQLNDDAGISSSSSSSNIKHNVENIYDTIDDLHHTDTEVEEFSSSRHRHKDRDRNDHRYASHYLRASNLTLGDTDEITSVPTTYFGRDGPGIVVRPPVKRTVQRLVSKRHQKQAHPDDDLFPFRH